jgi:hypothetical protein
MKLRQSRNLEPILALVLFAARGLDFRKRCIGADKD